MRMIQIPGKPYEIGVTAVTQLQWREVMGTEPWKKNGRPQNSDIDDYPATYISWNNAMAFCQKLGNMTGMVYRLPTEAELGHAYSVESSSFRFSCVWEWCSDRHIDGTCVVMYGDSWRDTAGFHSAWCRDHNSPESCQVGTGFRLARTLKT